MPDSPQQSDPSLIPSHIKLPSVSPAGYAAPVHIAMESESNSLAETALAVLADPVAQLKLCDRIAELMAQDLRLRGDRNGDYSNYQSRRG